MADSFEVNDPVLVSEESRQLEGVVAWRGPVDFADGDDWIGVRLTGGCVGLGNNDGSVEGKEYFSCPPDCGLFVRAVSVTKRQLTKLEELRLKRELAGATKKPSATTTSTTASATGIASTSGTSSTLLTPTKVTDHRKESKDDVSQTPIQRVDSTPTLTKLEELRLRRAALKEKKESTKAALSSPSGKLTATEVPNTNVKASRETSPTAAVISSPSLVSPREDRLGLTKEVQRLTDQVSSIQTKLSEKENESTLLQAKLVATERELKEVKAALTTTVASDSKMKDQGLEQLQAKLNDTDQELQAARKALDVAKASRPQVVVSSVSRETEERVAVLESEVEEWKATAQEALSEVTNLKRNLEQEQKSQDALKTDLNLARAEAVGLKKEVQILTEKVEQRGSTDNSHYKDLAKLQAEISAHKRKVEALEREKMDMEATIEDLTLDKEQLLEEKETLEDRVDELKLDAETAQMEVEELKMELEDVRQASVGASIAMTNVVGDDALEEKMTALSTQNLRLREALIRLREQTQVEKMEIMRQLRDAEKEADSGRELLKEVEELRSLKTSHEEQINDLKDMVEQGSAFEEMVEDLTDRIFGLEEENSSLKTVLREMEEAAELTAEMEEVQSEELKALSRDLESRDAVINNLEEAIKIQRRREEDLQRTVGNYRMTVATLNQEKQALLDLYQGGEGEKSDLIAASQSALARASQLVSDAAALRKREALSTLDAIDKDIYKNFAYRLENLLPQNIAGLEVSAIRGELMVSKVISRGSKALENISNSLSKATRPAFDLLEGGLAKSESTDLPLTDEVRQKALLILHQAEFAQTIVSGSSDLIRLLTASLWPDLLSPELSAQLASNLGHSIDELDQALGAILKSIIEEGDLSPEHASIGGLQQAISATMQSLQTDNDRGDEALVPLEWNPPGWELMRDASIAKFSCLGMAAAFSCYFHDHEDAASQSDVAALYNNLEKAASQGQMACLRLISLDINNTRLIEDLSVLAAEWKAASLTAWAEMKTYLASTSEHRFRCAAVDAITQSLTKFAVALRSANLQPVDSGDRYHALSPETDHCWSRLASLSRAIRAINGDEDDVNYLVRSRIIEQKLTQALENEGKLILAKSRVDLLENSLATKAKELTMQTARLSELEKEMAKGSAHVTRTIDLTASDEFGRLTDENRILNDAMLHWQAKAEEYEMALRDLKSPSAKSMKGRTPRRGLSSVSDITPYSAASDERIDDVGALEAALFRPALQQALRECSKWKAISIGKNLNELAPLQVPARSTDGAVFTEPERTSLVELTMAVSHYRMVKAAACVVDLTNQDKTPYAQLQEFHSGHVTAIERLHAAVSASSAIRA